MPLNIKLATDSAGTEPSPVIWDRLSMTDVHHRNGRYFWEDFTAFALTEAVASNAGTYVGDKYWHSYEDTGDAITQLATDANGVVAVSLAATNNNESWMQAGSATSVMFVPKTKANGGTSIFFEARVQMSTLVGNMFVGLAEEAAAAANFIADSAGTPADKDYIGFLVDEDAPTIVRFVYGKASGTQKTIASTAHTFAAADEFVKLGFVVDMDEYNLNQRVKGYANGVDIGSYLTNTLYENTTDFPTGEEMHVIFGGKNNNAAKVVRADWIRAFQLRES